MNKPKKNSSEIDDRLEPLAEDLTKLKRVELDPEWAQGAERLRGPKHPGEARAWFQRKTASTMSESFKTMAASEAVLCRDWDRPEEDVAWADL